MENTSVDTSVEVKKYDYEGKVKQHYNNDEEQGSVWGFYFCVGLFLAIFFAVIIVQMYSL
ncbi:hypothetical protein ABMA70_14285 [Halobacteriovorax sp. XZX-3]|uniref:hypothetical protein n=1 Tax=unclassified Halobacteriovorax TaxID=2639665 RepID=UPI000CD1C87A|nr:hypothetical protein [Halobacteriovorax sp. DA5]POB13355.1 hypothetical protein C0Z22_09330 [Halobacteriovorax sp. DA5]